MNKISLSAIATMSLFLAGCGGASSGGVASTPAPAPTPAPTNTSLTDLKASQSFVNEAASTTAAWDLVTNTGISGTAKRNSLTISYDVSTKDYTVSSDGRTQTFGQADVQSSSAGETRFKKSVGTGNEYLTLVKVPYTGTQPTQYVGLGTWQRNVINGSTQNTDFAAFTFGLPTATAAVPRTGVAGYSVDAFGLTSAPGKEPRSFQGRGQFSIDFGAAVFSSFTSVTETELVSGGQTSGGLIEISAAGRLSATDGTFSGNALYSGWFGRAGGLLEGRFYGPSAQELGASFYGTNASGMTVAGAFTGQRDANVQPVNLTLTNLRSQQLFFTQFGPNTTGQLDWQNSETFVFTPFSSGLNGGQFTINDKIASSNPNFTTYRKTFAGSLETQEVTLSLYKPGTQNTELALTYATFGRWSGIPQNGGGPFPTEYFFTYGLETPARLLSSKTGTGRYVGIVYGRGLITNPALVYYAVKGTSTIDVDFGTQRYSGALAMNGQPTGAGSSVDFGSFNFAGPLAAFTSGTSVGLTRGSVAVGQLDTRFYGPDGDEIAGPFALNVPTGGAGAGTYIDGVVVAKRQ